MTSLGNTKNSHYEPEIPFKPNDIEGKVEHRADKLTVIWGKDPRYWKRDESSGEFELVQVSWLEVKGSVPRSALHPESYYKLTFNVTVKSGAFGFDNPVYVMVKFPGCRRKLKRVDIGGLERDKATDIPDGGGYTFDVPKKYRRGDVTFGLYDIWNDTWKGGLVIHKFSITQSKKRTDNDQASAGPSTGGSPPKN